MMKTTDVLDMLDVLDRPERLEALRRTEILDLAPPVALDRLTRLATTVLDAPAALVSFVGADRLFIKSAIGLEAPFTNGAETPLAHCFCRHVLASDQLYAIPDALGLEEFATSPLVHDLGMRAFAGVPITSSDGFALGSLCVMDRVPRAWQDRDLRILADLAASIVTEIELWHENLERDRAAAFAARQRQVLEHVATGRALPEVLGEVTRLVEGAIPGSRCSVMLLEPGKGLRLASRSSLPPTFIGPDDIFPIGQHAGTCGTAADRRVPVVTRDIANDPTWTGLHELAARHGIRACWSTPILGAAGDVLGTFALYREEPWAPAPEHERLVAEATSLARIAIERVRAERALRESEERYALAARATSNAIWDWSFDTGALHWSEGWTTVFGHERSAQTERIEYWNAEVHPDDKARVGASIHAVIDSGGTEWRDSYRFRRADGTWAHVIDRGYVARDASGKAVRMIGAMEDVTAQHQLEERLRQAQKMQAVGQLAGGIAHDFNNLLTVISGNLQFLDTDLPATVPPDHPARAELLEIAEATERARNLVRQLLTFSRKQPIAARPVPVDPLVEGTERLLRRLVGKEIALEVSSTSDATVVADPGQLEQVLMNLALNARDAMCTPRHGHHGQGGSLMILVDAIQISHAAVKGWDGIAPGRWVRIRVRDTGHGMDDETKARLFEPFYTTKDVGAGTGLGLATVFGIVQQAGGTIRLESAPGRGTTFTVMLPAVEPTVPASVPLGAGVAGD
jgi:PAS domain S-box-containing protein